MTTSCELIARSMLCRQLARREPNSRVYWLAEAENWRHLSRKAFVPVRSGDQDPFERLLRLMDKPLRD